MFRIQTKPEVRILDVPLKLIVTDTFILVPLGEDKVMILNGNFKHIRDEEAFRIAREHLDKIAS